MADQQKTKAELLKEISELRTLLSSNGEKEKVQDQLRVFSYAIEKSTNSVLITDANGNIEYVNPMFTQITGYSSMEVIGKNPRLMKSGRNSEEDYADLWTTITEGASWKGRLCNRKKNGEFYWENISISPVFNDFGNITHFIAFIEDTTDFNEAEEALEQERRLLRTVIDNIPDQVFVHDLECRFVLNNLSDAYAIGVDDPAVLVGKSDMDYYPPELAVVYQANDREVMKSDKPVSTEDEPSVTRDGRRRWVSVIKVPLHDHKGKVIGLVGVARDVTLRKIAEDESFRLRQMLQLVVDNIPMWVYWKDNNLVYQGCNQDFATKMGLTNPMEIVGKTDFDLPWKRDIDQLRSDDDRVIKSEIPELGFEESFRQEDGSTLWTSINKIPLIDRDGKGIGLLTTTENITERRLAEQEIKETNEKLLTSISDLEIRNQQGNLMRQMGDLLQVSNEREEYFTIINEYVPQLFPETSGALFILNNSQSSVTAVTVWGDGLQSEKSFAPNECWAMRRSQIYQGNSSKPGLTCKHIKKPFHGCYLEVPMMASGEMIGVLHIEDTQNNLPMENILDLAHTVADHLSLSLSNLKLRESLRSQSIRDALTGLFNRRYMEESLGREIPRSLRKNSPVGIIMLDIDHFKDFNDTNGHEAGDVILRELGALLQNHIRGEDIPCRYGGEEFILILPEANLEVTVERAERIRQAIKSMRVEYRQQPLGLISVSLGVAIFPEHSKTVGGILKKADEALYQAKHNGRDRVDVARADG